MSFKGTLRRTLALLLVLIFALSNMGLAEMAEQIAESIPEAEPQIEEVAAEEAASEPTEEAEDAEAAPDEGAPAAAEQKEPAPAAESVSVYVQAIDETELCAYETIEPAGIYDVSYMWERAESEDGEWTALDETSDVLQSDAEDRAAYVYRCTVTVNGISATSDPATFDWGAEAPAEEPAEADEPVFQGEDIGIMTFNEKISGVTIEIDATSENTNIFTGKDKLVNIPGNTDTVKLKINSKSANPEIAGPSTEYKWEVDTTDESNKYIALADAGNAESASFTLAAGAKDLTMAEKKTVKVKCTITDNANSCTVEKTFDVLPPVSLAGKIKYGDEEAGAETPIQGVQLTSENTMQAIALDNSVSLTDYDGAGTVQWSIVDKDDSTGQPATTWASLDSSGNTLEIAARESQQYGADDADGHDVYVKASLALGHNAEGAITADAYRTINIKPAPASVSLKVDGVAIAADAGDGEPAKKFPDGAVVKLTAETTAPTLSMAEGAEDVKVACADEIQWKIYTGTESGSISIQETVTETAKTYNLTVLSEKKYYSVQATSKWDPNGSGVASKTDKFVVLPLADKAEADNANVTIVANDANNAYKDLTVNFKDAGGESATGIYDVVTWKIDEQTNKWGSAGGTYIVADDTATSKTLQVTQSSNIGTGTTGDGVHITATVKTKDPDTNGKAVDTKIDFYVAVKPENSKTLDPAKIKFKDDISEIGNPTTSVGIDYTNAPAWAQTTAYIDDASFDDYEVTWSESTDEEKEAAGVDVNSSQYIHIDPKTGVITALGEPGVSSQEGVTVAVKATVKTNGGLGTSAYKTLKVYPAAPEISIGKVTTSGSTSKTDWYTGTDHANANQALTVLKGTTLKLMVAVNKPDADADAKTKYFGSITGVTSEEILTDATAESKNVPFASDIASVDISKAGTYKITATSTTDTRNFYIEVQEKATDVHFYASERPTGAPATPAATPEPLPDTLYPNDSASDSSDAATQKIHVYPFATVDGKEVDAFSGTMKWTLSSRTLASTSIVASAVIDGTKPAPDTAGKIYLELASANATNATLHIPKNLDFTGKQSLQVNVQPEGMSSYKSQVFNIVKVPNDNPLKDAELTLDYNDIVQGETFNVTLGAKANQPALNLADYNVEYKIVPHTDKDEVEQAEVADWITVSKTNNTSAKLSATAAGTKNTLGAGQEEGLKFTIKASIPGLVDGEAIPSWTTVDADVTIMAMPKGVRVVYCNQNGQEIKTKDDDGSDEYEIPSVVLPRENTIYLQGVFVADQPAGASIKKYSTPSRVITLTADARTYATLTQVPDADNPGKNKDYYSLTALKKQGNVKVTGSYKIGTETLTDDIEIKVIDESPVVKDSSITYSDNGAHIWTLKPNASGTKYGYEATSEGHVYTCINQGCRAESKPVAHTGKYIVFTSGGTHTVDGKTVPWTPEDVTKLKADGKYLNPGAGYVICEVCGYECTHEDEGMKTGAVNVDIDYHKVTCPICGKELLQKHEDADENGACDVCGKASVQVKLNNEDAAVVIAGSEETFEPKISIIGSTQDWSAEFKAAAGDEEYIEVDPHSGAVTGVKVKPDGAKATVEAKITVSTTSDTKEGKKTFTDEFDWSFDVTIKNPTGAITVTSDNHDEATNTDFVIGGKLLKLTATPANEKPQLDGYKWQLDNLGADAAKGNIFFVRAAESTEYANATVEEKGYVKVDPTNSNPKTVAALSATSILLYVDDDTTASNIVSYHTGDNALKITYGIAGDTDAEKGEIEVEVLPPLAKNNPATTFDDQLTKAITFGGEYTDPTGDAVKLIEGSSVELSMLKWTGPAAPGGTYTSTPFETRYGDVKFGVETKNPSDVKTGDVKNWIAVEGSTVTTKTGMLSSTKSDSKNFYITATIVLGKDDDGNEIKAVGRREVSIVSAPTKITIKYKDDKDAYVAVPETGLEVFAGDPFDLKVEIEGGGVALSDLVWKANPETAVVPATGTNNGSHAGDDPGTYHYVVAQGASDFDINVGCIGKTETLHVTVKKLFTDLKVSVENAKVAVGEMETAADGSQSPKEIKITVQKVPADAKDTYTLTAYAVDTTYTGLESDDKIKLGSTADADDTLFKAVEGDEDSMKIVVDSDPRDGKVADEYPIILIEAEANRSKKPATGEEDAPNITGSAKIELYRQVTNGNEAFVLETAKNGADKLVLTVGADTTITKHGYDATQGYGSSNGMDLDVVVTDEKDAQDQDADIIEVVGDKITAKAVGTATISIHDFNYDEDAKSGPHKDLQVTVKPAIDALITTDDSKVKSEYDIGVGTASAVTIEQSAFTATRTAEEEGAEPTPVGADEAKIELKSDDNDGVVSITDDGNGNWVIAGVKPGTAHLYAGVGSTSKSAEFTVNVGAEAEGVRFVDAEGNAYAATNNQIVREFDQLDPIVLTVTGNPENAFGDVTVEGATNESSDVAIEGTTVTVTPKAAGSNTITASIPNPKWDNTTDQATKPQYLTGYMTIVVLPEGEEGGDTPEPPVETENTIEVVDKQAIGPGETTRLVVTGLAAGETVSWSAEPATAATVAPDPTDSKTAIVTYVGAGKAEITATIGDRSVSKAIYTLTAPTNVEFYSYYVDVADTMNLAKNETLELRARIPEDGGYDFTPEYKTEAMENEVYIDSTGLFTYSVSDEKSLSIESIDDFDGDNGCTVKALAAKGNASVTVSVKGVSGVSKSINFALGKANTSFKITGIDGTLYMAPGDSKTFDITTSPKGSKVNLSVYIADEEDELYGDDTGITVTQSDNKLTFKAAEDAATGKEYNVNIRADGYAGRVPLSFKLFVQPKATAEDKPILAVKKVGVDGTGYKSDEATGVTTGKGSVTVVNKEKLQAYFIDETGNPVAGEVDWTAYYKSLKKADRSKISISATGLITAKKSSGSVTLSPSVGGVTATGITLNFAKAPKVTLAPTDTTRTVAIDEPFQLKLDGAYPDANANEWYTISFTNDLGFTPVEDEEKPDTYTFSKSGTTKATLTPVWGGSAKTVTFTVVENLATSFDVPDVVKVPSGTAATTIVTAKLLEEGSYANLTWLAGATEIGKTNVKIDGDNNFKVKKLSNNEIQITTTKNASGEKKLLVKGPGFEEDGKEITIQVEAAATDFPADTSVVFGKKIITIGESTTVGLDFGEDEAPAGKITYSYVKDGSTAKVSIKGNVVKATGTKAGVANVQAKLGSGKNAATKIGQIYVLPKASIVTSMNPTKMGAYSTLRMDVTIKNYDGAGLTDLDNYLPIDTTGVLSVETNNKQIQATLSQDVSGDAPNKYTLLLDTQEAMKNSKGKYTTTTVTLRLTNGAKKTMKIQVVDDAEKNSYNVYVPESITIAKGMKYTLIAATADSANSSADIYWVFEDENADAAKEAGLSIENGQLVASTEGGTTQADAPIILNGYIADGDSLDEFCSVEVNVVATKAKGQFKIVLPNRALYAGEKILATVQYDAGYGSGDVTWKSNQTKVISVDKKTGLLTVLGKYKNKTSATITATTNKKSVKTNPAINVVDAPTELAFDATELSVPQVEGVATTVDLAAHLKLGGTTVSPFADYKNVVEISAWIDTEDGFEECPVDNGVMTVKADAEPCVVRVSASTTANCDFDLSDSMLVLIGSGSSGEVTPPTPPTPEKEYDAASVKLQMNGQPLEGYTQDKPLMMSENDEYTIDALVYDANGELFAPADADVHWSTDNETSVGFEGAGDTVKLLAKKATIDSNNMVVQAKVSCEVAKKDGTLLPAVEFYVQISYAIRKENVKLTLVQESLLKGDSTTATFAITVPSLAQQYSDAVVTLVNQTEEIIEVTYDEISAGWTIKGLEVGEGSIQVILKTADGKTLIDDYIVKVPVNALPTADQIQIKDAAGNDITKGTMTLGQGEPGEFEVVLPEGFTAATGDIGVTVTNPKANPDGTYTTYTTSEATWNNKPIEDSAETEPAKFIITGNNAATAPKLRVVVEVYRTKLPADAKPEDHITQEFTVEVKASPTLPADILIDATPEIDEATATIQTAVGEPVTLTASLGKVTGTKTDLVWEKGFVWTTSPDPTAAEPADENNPTITTSEDGKTLTITPNSSDVGYAPITVTVALKDAPLSMSGVQREIMITVKEKPTTSLSGKGMLQKSTESDAIEGDGSTATPITIGEKESVKVEVNFNAPDAGDNADSFTSDVTWKPATGSISVSSETGTSTTVTGVSKTTGTVNLEAWSGSVKLGTLVFKVLAAPTAADVDLKDCQPDGSILEGATLSRKMTQAAMPKVAVDMGADKSATFELNSSNDRIKCTPDAKKNVWQLSYGTGDDDIEIGANSVTLTLVCKELNIRKNYNVTVTVTGVQVEPSAEAQQQGVEKPIEVVTPGSESSDFTEEKLPEGFEGGKGGPSNPQEFFDNQQTVKQSVVIDNEKGTMDITLSVPAGKTLHKWASSEYDPGNPKAWYVLVIDTGVEISKLKEQNTATNAPFYVGVSTDPGTKPSGNGNISMSNVLEQSDCARAQKWGAPTDKICTIRWIDMDALTSTGFKVCLWTQSAAGVWNDAPYMTITVKKG